MSKWQKSKRAAQARRRRARVKNCLQILSQKASVPGATSSIVNEYNAAAEKRANLLAYDKDRAAIQRKHLKNDIAEGKTNSIDKAKMLKRARKLSYLKQKKNGQMKA